MKIYSPNSIIFPEPAWYKCFIIPNETKKTHTRKYCWQTYYKSIEMLSQTFKFHIHDNRDSRSIFKRVTGGSMS